MRFQQLNRDPNSVMRKKLVKSKKNWVVVSSLSLVGGLFLLGGPTTETVKADEVTTPATTQVSTPSPSSTGTTSTASAAAGTSTDTAAQTSAPSTETTKTDDQTSTSTNVDKTQDVKESPDTGKQVVTNQASSTEKADETVTPTETAAKNETPDTAKQADNTDQTASTQKDVSDDAPTTDETDGEKASAIQTSATVSQDDSTSTDATTDATTKNSSANLTPETTKKDINDKGTARIDTDALSKTVLNKLVVNGTEELKIGDELDSLQTIDSLIADTVVPVVEDNVLATTPATGNNWSVDETGKVLTINGQLDESEASTTIVKPYESKPDSSTVDDSSIAQSKTNTLWGGNAATISTINFETGAKAPVNSAYIFANMPNLTTLNNIQNFDTSKTTSMQGMFKNDTSLTSVDLSKNNVASVTNMSHMFENDSSLTETLYAKKIVNEPFLGVSVLVTANSQYANDKSLTNPGVGNFQSHYLIDTASMFKNDNNIGFKSLDIGGWLVSVKTETGDSSNGEGMFDGTDFDSITIYNGMYFNPKTALTSTKGAIWSNGSQTFYGIPNATLGNKGLGDIYIGSKSVIAGAGNINTTYTAQKVVDKTQVTNLITIQTNHGPVSFEATGAVGSTVDVTASVPTSKTINGVTYQLATGQTVKATIGQTMATAVIDGTGAANNIGNPVTYLGKDNPASTINITDSTGKATGFITIPEGHEGDDPTTVTVTAPTGYIPSTTTVTVEYTSTGIPVLKDDKGNTIEASDITYSGEPTDKDITVPFTDDNGNIVNSTIPAGSAKVGDTVKVSVPEVKGYTPNVSEISGTIDTDGNFVPDSNNPKVSYVGNPTKDDITVPFKDANGNTVNATIPAGSTSVGNKVTVTVPNVTGYTPSVKKITGTIDPEGNFVPDSTKPADVTFSGNPTKNDIIVPFTDANGNTVDSTIPAGSAKVGDTVKVPVPEVKGYTPNVSEISGTIDTDGNFVPDSNNPKVSYVGNPTKDDIIVPFKDANGNTVDATIPAGATVGSKVTVKVPDVAGYTPNVKEITGTIDPEGNFVPDSTKPADVTFSGNPTKNDIIVPFTDANGNTVDSTIPAGSAKVGDTVKVPVPEVKGYTPNVSEISGTIDTDGNFVPDSNNPKVSYVGNPTKDDIIVPFKDANGNTVDATIPAGATVGSKVTVKVPDVAGYTPSVKEITGTIDPEGNFVPDSTKPADVTFSGNPTKNDIIVPFKDANGNTVNATIPAGSTSVGGKVTVTVPDVTGYTPNVKEITGTIDPEGNFVPDSTKPADVTFSGNPTKNDIIVPFKDANGNTVNATIPAGSTSVGGKVTVTVPDVTGYTPNVKEITGTIDPEGNFVPDSTKPADVTFSGNPTKNDIIVPFKDANGNTVNATIPAGLTSVGGKVTVTVPDVTGYTPNVSEISGTIDSEGNFVPDSTKPADVTFSGNPTKDDITVPFTDANGNTVDATIPAGATVGSKVTVTVPDVTGYTPNVKEITGTIDPEGNFVPDSTKPADVTFSGNPTKDDITVPFTDANGNTIDATIPAGATVGSNVTVKVPDVTGYTPNVKEITGTIDSEGNFVPDSTKLADVTFSGNPTKDDITVPFTDANGNTIDATIPAGATVGSNVTVKVPDVTGYTPNVKEITGTIDSEGNFVPDSTKPADVTFSGNLTKNDITVPFTDANGNTVDATIPAGSAKVGDTVKVTVPEVKGYTPNVSEISGTIDTDGNFVPDSNNPKVSYVGNPTKVDITVPFTDANGNTVDATIPAGSAKVGDTVKVTVPEVKGYTPNVSEISGTIDTDGNFVPDSNNPKVSYVGNPTKNDITVPFTDANGNTVDATIPAGSAKVGDTVKVTVPEVKGYTPNVSEISVTIDPNGNFVPDSSNPKVIYSGNSVENATATIKATENGSTNLPDLTISNISGHVGQVIDVKVPDKAGYTHPASVKGTILPDGKTVQIDEPVNYEGIKYTDSVATIKTNNHGNQQVQHVAGQVGTVVTVKVPTIEGYTPDKETVSGIMDENGDVNPTDVVNYTANTIDGKGTGVLTTNLGDKNLTGLSGTVDDKGGVSIDVPDVTGYTPNKTKITGTMNPDGTVTPNEEIIYTGNPVNNQSLNLPIQKDNQDSSQIIDGLTGIVGQTIDVKVPNIPGYKSNKTTIKATINPDGSITTDETVTYTKIPSSHGNGNTINEDPVVVAPVDPGNQTTTTPIKNPVNVATFADQPDVQLYQIDSDSNVTPIGNDTLINNSAWYSDQKITIDGTTYYRVATNKWAKSSQVYTYEDKKIFVRTYDDSDKDLYKAENELVKDKTVPANSDWITDRTIQLDENGYYRISSNEFVKTADAYVYEPINAVVQTRSIPRIDLYTAKGVLIKNRSLAGHTAWLADSIVYINGVKFYRVATNEFVKASDVEGNY